MIRAVIFDLDDTLFDHRYCAREGLQALRENHDVLTALDLVELDRRHADVLESLHRRVLAKEISLDAARQERFRQLFESAGVPAAQLEDGSIARAAAAMYRARYLQSWREVPGATALLCELGPRVRLGVVSNNLTQEQYDKLRFCGFERLLHAIVISEEAGVAKPDPAIFRLALERLAVDASEAVMIGDGWATDIAGARAAGLRAIWFNPSRLERPEPCEEVDEIDSLEPVASVASLIFRDEDSRRGR